jgi:CHAT domain-containing protein
VVAFVRYEHATFDATPSGAVVRRVVPSYAAFVLRAGERVPGLVRLGPAAEIDQRIRRWRESATAGVTDAGTVDPGAEARMRAAGTGLRARIWDPLVAAIADAGTVFIVPDGALNLVPFAALPDARAAYLIDRAPLHYLSAERDLTDLNEPVRTLGKGLLAVGGPAYGAPTHAASRATSCGTLDAIAFGPLPASRREAEEVGSLWRTLAGPAEESLAIVLTGAGAREGAFKASSPGHRVLHVATHGFFLGADCAPTAARTRGVGLKGAAAVVVAAAGPRPKPPDNPLLLSGLALAGANRRTLARADGEDGILTAEEVAGLNLDGVEWAVLSACDSGLGQIRGGEGVFGLRRAFKTAGARTVIMSLWPVEDRATGTWMRALYRARLEHRRSTSDAMRDASLAVLAARRAGKQSTHPFFWAGFVAAGDWR